MRGSWGCVKTKMSVTWGLAVVAGRRGCRINDAAHGFHSWSGTYRARPLFSEVPGGANRQADLNEAGEGVRICGGTPREFVLVAPLSWFKLPTRALTGDPP
jgi:hypothetical protein